MFPAEFTTGLTHTHARTHKQTHLCRAGGEHCAVAQGQGVHVLHQGLRAVVLADVLAAPVVRVHGEPVRGVPAAPGSCLYLADVPCTTRPINDATVVFR